MVNAGDLMFVMIRVPITRGTMTGRWPSSNARMHRAAREGCSNKRAEALVRRRDLDLHLRHGAARAGGRQRPTCMRRSGDGTAKLNLDFNEVDSPISPVESAAQAAAARHLVRKTDRVTQVSSRRTTVYVYFSRTSSPSCVYRELAPHKVRTRPTTRKIKCAWASPANRISAFGHDEPSTTRSIVGDRHHQSGRATGCGTTDDVFDAGLMRA